MLCLRWSFIFPKDWRVSGDRPTCPRYDIICLRVVSAIGAHCNRFRTSASARFLFTALMPPLYGSTKYRSILFASACYSLIWLSQNVRDSHPDDGQLMVHVLTKISLTQMSTCSPPRTCRMFPHLFGIADSRKSVPSLSSHPPSSRIDFTLNSVSSRRGRSDQCP